MRAIDGQHRFSREIAMKSLDRGQEAFSAPTNDRRRREMRPWLFAAAGRFNWWSTATRVFLLSIAVGSPFGGISAARAQNLGSPAFANPTEIDDSPKDRKLVGTIVMSGGTLQIPGTSTETLRMFRSGSASASPNVQPAPTLRARVGDLVEITFLNKVDDSMFPYTFDTTPTSGGFGCDEVTVGSGTGATQYYPSGDVFPNCFHGSSTANLHFHGTHTDPDGLGDNVLIQILPQVNQPDWTPTFNKIYNSGKIPQHWSDMPKNYRTKQMAMIGEYDKTQAANAEKNGLPKPESLLKADERAIAAGQWPQYLIGAFPNFFLLPDYNSGEYGAGQAPGTHWYHAHKHGSTSLHMLNGMAGAFIIESADPGGYDKVIREFYGWGDIYGNHEKVIVLNEFDSTVNAERPNANGTEQMLVNGLATPTITMAPGEVQLWRIVNATAGDNFIPNIQSLQSTNGFGIKQTAQDGVQFSQSNYGSQPYLSGAFPGGMNLSAGNRVDLLVQAPTKPGVYAITNTENDPATTIFFVSVMGSPVTPPNGNFPSQSQWAVMPKYLLDLPKPGKDDIPNPNSPVKFQSNPAKTDPVNGNPWLMINGQQFEQNGPIINQCMPLNGLQDWVLENDTAGPAHPFHIHVNPFQIVEIDTPNPDGTYSKYLPANNYIWQDVIAIPVAQTVNGTLYPGKVVIRQRYPDFTGTFVLHCHILPHEDRGMMQLVRIVPANQYPLACQKSIPQHH
jgi:FtsP/CotA-like multicopper oxidase with cupredoxin domain